MYLHLAGVETVEIAQNAKVTLGPDVGVSSREQQPTKPEA